MGLVVGEEVGEEGLIEMGGVEAGEDLGLVGEEFGEAAEDFGVVVFGFETFSLIGGGIDDDEIVGSAADEAAPGFEEIVGKVAGALAGRGVEVEVVVFASGGERAAGHVEINNGVRSAGEGGDGE